MVVYVSVFYLVINVIVGHIYFFVEMFTYQVMDA